MLSFVKSVRFVLTTRMYVYHVNVSLFQQTVSYNAKTAITYSVLTAVIPLYMYFVRRHKFPNAHRVLLSCMIAHLLRQVSNTTYELDIPKAHSFSGIIPVGHLSKRVFD